MSRRRGVMTDPLVSVALPVHNARATIVEIIACVHAVLEYRFTE